MAKKPLAQGAPTQGRYRVAVYPGTFDPVTNGHLDIIGRATKVVDRLVVAVAVNGGKGPLFSLKERVAMCRRGWCKRLSESLGRSRMGHRYDARQNQRAQEGPPRRQNCRCAKAAHHI